MSEIVPKPLPSSVPEEPGPPRPVIPEPPARVRSRRPWLVPATVLLAAGCVAVGAHGFGGALPMAARVVLSGLGVGAGLTALDDVLKRRVGPHVDTGFWVAVGWLALVVVAAAGADFLPLSEGRNVSETLDVPSLLRPDLLSAHPLGTDRQGLDILAGIIYGARVSMIVGLGAVVVGTAVGGLIGLLAGYYRGVLERVVSILSDSLLAFPPLVLLLAMVAVLEASVRNVTIGLAILVIPTYIRLVKANTLTFVQREFVTAARALGARDRRILIREVVPNVALPVLSYSFLIVAVLIVAEASLSFLGLSIQRPNPTWGNLIAAGQNDFDRHPHLVFAPGLVLFLTVFSLNRIGERLRRMWEPHAR